MVWVEAVMVAVVWEVKEAARVEAESAERRVAVVVRVAAAVRMRAPAAQAPG